MKTLDLTQPRILAGILILILSVTGSSALFAAAAPENLENSIVVVETYVGNQSTDKASGFVVQSDRYNGYVVTNAESVADSDSVVVTSPITGGKLVADILRIDRSGDYALLKVNGLNMPPLEFARTEPGSGEVVWSAAKLNGTETVTISRGLLRMGYKLSEEDTGWYQHTAAIELVGGSVLLNECGEVLGLNFTQPASDGSTRAVDRSTLKSLLRAQNVNVTTASAVCLSEIVKARQKADFASDEARRAQEEAEKAQAVARQLEKQLNESQRSNTSLIEQTRIAGERAEAAIVAAEQAQRRADNTRRELEEKTQGLREETKALLKSFEEDRAEAEARFEDMLRAQQASAENRERILMGLSAALIVLIGIILFFLRVRSTPAMETKTTQAAPVVYGSGNTAANHRGELSEYVLDGRDDDGIRYLLRISGDQLVNKDDGVIIGRNPKDSPYIINHADVSRKHARIKVKNNRVFIEDLGSTNGTSVNGQSIDDKGPVSVDNGDQIIIGSVVMKLRVMDG